MKKKAKYTKPRLETYGSVRNLTGGSIGTLGDTMGTMMLTM